MKKIIILITLILPIINNFAKSEEIKEKNEITCKEIPYIFNYAGINHAQSKLLTPNIIEKSLLTLLDMLDPYKILMTNQEFNSFQEKFIKNKDNVFLNLMNGKCDDYDNLISAIIQSQSKLHSEIEKIDRKKFIKSNTYLYPSLTYNYSNYDDIINTLSKLNYSPDQIIESLKPYTFNTEKEKTDLYTVLIVKSLLKTLDPHSDYLSLNEVKDFDSMTTATNYGLGIVINYNDDFTQLTVQDVLENSPVYKNGNIKKGDILTSINEVKVEKKNIEQIQKEFEKNDGPIKIKFKKVGQNEEKEALINKEKYDDASAKVSSKIMIESNKKILYIKIPSFYRDTSDEDYMNHSSTSLDVITHIFEKRLLYSKIDGIIIDLRGNSGGLLEEAMKLTSIFIKDPMVFMTKENTKVSKYDQVSIPQTLIKEPLVVLTNSFSASASEIFAGAIKSYGRGLIVGDETTFGKGSMQTVIKNTPFYMAGILKITTANYYFPNGESPHAVGLNTDIVIPSHTNKYPHKESSLRFSNSLEKISVFVDNKIDASLIDTLKKNSNKRHEKNLFFNYLIKSGEELELSKIEDFFKDNKDPILDEAKEITKEYISKHP